ncbi:unnamed protein product, partial [Timema podura]|nr:unnamed protein product [Timema podura]
MKSRRERAQCPRPTTKTNLCPRHSANVSSTDLLGLSTPPSSQPTAPAAGGTLLDMFGDVYPTGSPNNVNNLPPAASSTYNSKKFVCKNNGVLFENDLIQIGVKSEFRQNLGRLGLFYGNKTSFALQNFAPTISCPDSLVSKLNVQVKPVEPVLEAGAQIQQMINVECVEDFTGT